jgi:hypothetical protein
VIGYRIEKRATYEYIPIKVTTSIPMDNSSSLIVRLYKSLASQSWDVTFIALLLVFEALLSVAIVKFVPYTEIDWEAYMQEVSMWQDGEMDYTKIYGGTGPLVS